MGARFFPKGYEAMVGAMNTSVESKSPRDTDGHGTHAASIATGRHVYKANMLGYASGIAKGMALKARLATYKVCWQSGCFLFRYTLCIQSCYRGWCRCDFAICGWWDCALLS